MTDVAPLAETGTDRGPPPLAVYIHWPYCRRICPYCDFNVVRDRGQEDQAALARAIVNDLQGQALMTGPRRLTSVFFGGGTPSLMRPEWVAAIIVAARRLWTPAPDLEVSLEANPTDAEANRYADFATAGVNRLSLGVQAFDDDALAFLGRDHNADEAIRASQAARKAFPRLSLDLIYARPGQTSPAWADELRQAITLNPEHLSPYQLTIEPGTAFERAVTRGVLIPPGADVGADLYETTQDMLEAAGYDAYEVSNHARGAQSRSRHNLAYWRGWDYLGAGPGAHGRLTVDGQRLATYAAPKVRDYIARVAETGRGWMTQDVLSPREASLERLLMGLRIEDGVAWDEVAAAGVTPNSRALLDMSNHGLLQIDSAGLRATRRGRQVLNSLIGNLVQ